MTMNLYPSSHLPASEIPRACCLHPHIPLLILLFWQSVNHLMRLEGQIRTLCYWLFLWKESVNVYSKPTAPYAQTHWIGYIEFIFVQTEQSPNKQTFSSPQMKKLYFNLLTTVLKMTNTIIDKSKPFNIEK